MLNNIIKALLKSKLILSKIVNKVIFTYSKIGYSESKYFKEQEVLFSDLGLDYLDSIDKLSTLRDHVAEALRSTDYTIIEFQSPIWKIPNKLHGEDPPYKVPAFKKQ